MPDLTDEALREIEQRAERMTDATGLEYPKDLVLRLCAALRAERDRRYPNNVVACVNCKSPVVVTAINAIRCAECERHTNQGGTVNDLKLAALRFTEYARTVKRLDRDVVMNYVEELERGIAMMPEPATRRQVETPTPDA